MGARGVLRSSTARLNSTLSKIQILPQRDVNKGKHAAQGSTVSQTREERATYPPHRVELPVWHCDHGGELQTRKVGFPTDDR